MNHLGNKCDLKREVSDTELKWYSRDKGHAYVESSIFDPVNIHKLVYAVVREVQATKPPDEVMNTVALKKSATSNMKCCLG